MTLSGLSDKIKTVAPHVGAWIEILRLVVIFIDFFVAPHVGAWIEIITRVGTGKTSLVAPHVGAWIEILGTTLHIYTRIVAPHVGAWIEIFAGWIMRTKLMMSHPMWVRGLKYVHFGALAFFMPSHPMWVRGLKLWRGLMQVLGYQLVAPHVGAWIEMTEHGLQLSGHHVAPHVGAWIEISGDYITILQTVTVAPHVGAWIEMKKNTTSTIIISRTPCGCVD